MERMDQKEFERVGDLVLGYVQTTMKVKYGMKEIWLGAKNGPKCNIFVSDDFFTNTGRCMVLIQGTGAVRAGFWARSVCINQGLVEGSVLRMIEFAKDLGQSVIVLNPNMSKDPLTGEKIANCKNMIEHTKFVWDNYLTKAKCPAQSLAIVAHSAGGRCVAALYKDYKREMLARVRCLVFTDALYHSMFENLRENEISEI